MSEKNSINHKLRKKFDKSENYRQILSRIEEENNMSRKIKKNVKTNNWGWLRFALVPACLALVIGGFMIFGRNDDTTTFISDNGNQIVINRLESVNSGNVDAARLDIDMKTDSSAGEKFSEFSFINGMKIPSEFNLYSKHLVYTKRLCETKEECVGAHYDILHDYVLTYEKITNGAVEKSIVVAFSKDFEPLRDYSMQDENLKPSKINGTDVSVASYNELYIATFRHNGLNFDIETKGISEIELVELLESIL